ncbi:MAG: septum formation family protein [Ilumatobacteraceae bacterium]
MPRPARRVTRRRRRRRGGRPERARGTGPGSGGPVRRRHVGADGAARRAATAGSAARRTDPPAPLAVGGRCGGGRRGRRGGAALVWPDDADAPDAPVDADADPATTVATAEATTVATAAVTEPEAATVSFAERPDGIAELGGDDIVWPLGPVGECLVLLPDSVELTPIGCDEPHDLQRITVASLPAEEYPPGAPFEIDVLRATSDDLCRLAFAEFVGVDAVESELSVAVTRPSADTWAEGDRALQCLVGVRDARIVGDAAGSGQ